MSAAAHHARRSKEPADETVVQEIESALAAIRRGEIIVVTDDEDRENEGDLIMAAAKVNAAAINFMLTHGRGLLCVALPPDRVAQLGLVPMPRAGGGDHQGTAFLQSVDAREGVTTGISAHDRARTIRVLMDPQARRDDLVSPGHIFPLEAREGGVLRRAGHTEAAVDLSRLAGLPPGGVICEILRNDGHMARYPELQRFARQHGLAMTTIRNLIAYRRLRERLVERVETVDLPTRYGHFRLVLYREKPAGECHVALVKGEVAAAEAPLVRVHSECLTGDVFGSCRCDCGEQLHRAMTMINAEGCGVVLYMRQEGRGIGLANKIHAYALQQRHGLDTVEANERLGFPADLRDYGIGAQILADLGLRRIRLLTNNPRKIVGLEGYGLRVVQRVPLIVPANEHSRRYLRAKKRKLGHLL
jgi:3,4-dihydroxy 2-butanone 4-phosphate synthase/GTP cyclohydrolase II